MSNWYDKDGKILVSDDMPIGSLEWLDAMAKVEALLGDYKYRVIGQDFGPYKDSNVEITVSTVWLGLDHNFMRGASPLIFETMVFGLPDEELQQRYTTLEEAKKGHKKFVKKYLT